MIASHDQKPAAANQPGLVIFDCDGVLVDSEPLSLACLTAGLNRIGVASGSSPPTRTGARTIR